MTVQNFFNGVVMWQEEEYELAIMLKIHTSGIDIIQGNNAVYITKNEVESFIKELRKLNKLGFKSLP